MIRAAIEELAALFALTLFTAALFVWAGVYTGVLAL